MWDEKTVENIAPTNSVRTPYELRTNWLLKNWTPTNSEELAREKLGSGSFYKISTWKYGGFACGLAFFFA